MHTLRCFEEQKMRFLTLVCLGLAAAVANPAVSDEFEKRSIIAVTSRSPAAFAAELTADMARKEKIVLETGIVVD